MLKFMDKVPTIAGWYWFGYFRTKDWFIKYPVEVYQDADGLWMTRSDNEHYETLWVMLAVGYFCGPIGVPEDLKEGDLV